MVTGRQDGFDQLRQRGGLSGYPSQAESEHDLIENSPRLDRAVLRRRPGQGVRAARRGAPRGRGRRRRRAHRRHVLGGAEQHRRRRATRWSSSSTTTAARTRRPSAASPTTSPRCGSTPATRRCSTWSRTSLAKTPLVGRPLYEVLHAVKKGIKDAVAPQAMFEDLGIKYVGPVDGHDMRGGGVARCAGPRRFGGPVIVHAVTRKGYGYQPGRGRRGRLPARPGRLRPETGKLLAAPCAEVDHGLRRRAGRASPTSGPTSSASPPRWPSRPASPSSPRKYPDRAFDVGIAEQHAATSAAGLALGGLHPVVAVYATFLNRAFDQVLLDVAHAPAAGDLRARPGRHHRPGRAEPLRHLGHVGLRRGARACASPRRATPPRCARSCARRSPSTTARRSCASRPARSPADLPGAAPRRRGRRAAPSGARKDVLLVAVGAFAPPGRGGRRRGSAEQGYGVTVVDPRWVRPVPVELVGLAAGAPARGRPSRTASAPAASATRVAQAAARRRGRRAAARTSACRAGLAPARHPRRDPGRPRPHRPGRGPRRHRLDGGARPAPRPSLDAAPQLSIMTSSS